MKKIILGTFFIVAFCAFTSAVQAQSSSFLNDLQVGSSGNDVVNLQTWLISNGFDIPAVSSGAVSKGYFGGQTKAAVQRYQSRMGLPSTGYVGPLTRGKLNGRGTQTGAPVINGLDAPTTLSTGQIGTWNIRATDPLNGTLSYFVLWGDEVNYAVGQYAPASPTSSFVQGLTFTHAYSNAGTYRVVFTVKNSSGQTVQTSSTVNVTATSGAGPLQIIYPKGGETWMMGTTQTITWTSPYYIRATYADIKVVEDYSNCNIPGSACVARSPSPHQYTIASNISINQNSYNWSVGGIMQPNIPNAGVIPPMQDGQYIVQICEVQSNNCTSSGAITIKSQTVKVLSPNGGEQLLTNSVRPIMWSLSGVPTGSKVDIDLEPLQPACLQSIPRCMIAVRAPYVLDRNIDGSGVYNWIVATDIVNNPIPTGAYKVRICLAGSQAVCDTSDNTFTIY